MLITLEPSLITQRQKASLTAGPDGSFVLADGAGKGAQTVDFRHADLARAILRLRVEFRPLDGASADFCIFNHARALLARVGRDGVLQVSTGPEILEATCTADASGWLQLDLRFRNFFPLLLIGLARPGAAFAGSGHPQFALRNFQVEVLEPRWTPSPGDGLVVLQAGAAPDPAWTPYLDGLRVLLCEPNEEAGRDALAALPAEGQHILLPNTLSNRNGAGKLNTTRDPAMSSLLDPDQRRLKPFTAAPGFEVTSSGNVPLTRFDTLSRQLQLPPPDLLRIRAGGAEFDVLRGCGDVLDRALAVEVQVHFYPLYRKQKLFGDITDLLDDYGFALRRLQPHRVGATSYEMVSGTAYLTRRKVDGAALGKVCFIEEVWGVSWPR
jgi:FkbM family methyltransferase